MMGVSMWGDLTETPITSMNCRRNSTRPNALIMSGLLLFSFFSSAHFPVLGDLHIPHLS